MSDEILSEILESVLDSIEIIEDRFADVKSSAYFIESDDGLTLLDSISMRLQHVAETIGKLYRKRPEFFAAHPSINWDDIIQFRNFISHHYEFLDHEIIYDICSSDMPLLRQAIEEMRQGL